MTYEYMNTYSYVNGRPGALFFAVENFPSS